MVGAGPRRSLASALVGTSLVLGSCAVSASPAPTASLGPSPTAALPSQPVPVDLPFPLEATIPELQEAMDAGRLTSAQLVDFYLDRIAAYDDAGPTLNAFILVNPAARDEAAALDAERAATGPRGPMHGIPVVLKDNIGTADMPTTGGSLALANLRPAEDAFQVRRLREAGAIVLGKTNMFEFAQGWTTVSSMGGQTLNPYDLTRDPGGSSGGSAVAVNANFAVAGFGTDSCGSVRFPAAHNDLFAIRPTSGLSSRTGVIPLSTTLDMVGPMTRSVVDLAIVLDATAGVDPEDPSTVPVEANYLADVDPGGLVGRRIGVLYYSVDPKVRPLIDGAIDTLVSNGAEIVEVKLPPKADPYRPFDEFGSALDAYLRDESGSPVHSITDLYDFYSEHPEADHAHLRRSGPLIDLDSDGYRAAIAGRAVFRDAVVALMDELDLDAIAYPESTSIAPSIGDTSDQPFDCSTAPYGGLPALVMPAGFTADGFPIGLELMGRPFAEPTLLAMAAGYEAHTSHRVLPPLTPPLR